MTEVDEKEKIACTPYPLNGNGFNKKAIIPYGLTYKHIKSSMNEFLEFIGFINTQLATRDLSRLESFLMPANFSSLVGEFMNAFLPKYCSTIVKNTYHNGHPDLLPKGMFPNDSMLHADKGIEVKASRHRKGWQGHNPEDVWLMVFVFDANSSRDNSQGIVPKPFRFIEVLGAHLTQDDWKFSGRSATSRRTITASVTRSGYEKMKKNWIYYDPDYRYEKSDSS